MLVWLAIVAIFGLGIAGNVAETALTYGVFMVLVGLGQMLVITSGVGNIDLSVPSTIALGILAVLGVGIAVGLANYALIRLLRIPPIIATLSSSFIIQSITITQGWRLPPPALGAFATGPSARHALYRSMALRRSRARIASQWIFRVWAACRSTIWPSA
ncbi:Ribose ABC transport system, permease protein RbsC [Candidatus Paraburkholderia calva]|nr:Ribose ABC transport system, permease protein RbsC [Candidatus Paraburkholderia calva]